MASGIDQNRLSLLLAVLEKRAGLNLLGEDVFINVAGGMTVDEPAADLAIVGAVASSLRNRADPPGHRGVRRGRACGRSAQRAAGSPPRCAKRRRWDLPDASCRTNNIAPDEAPAGCELVPVRHVGEALDQLMEW